jgi:RNA polymerase sigma-70 factor (ECF subfamily)
MVTSEVLELSWVGFPNSVPKNTDYEFELAVLRHLDSGYNLARWLVGNDQDAEDVVQEASLKALNSFSRFKGGQGRAWFLAIVRNASLDRIRRRRSEREVSIELEPDLTAAPDTNPEAILLRSFDTAALWKAIECLPVACREMIVMRELEELSYREIADSTSLPIGTVMSRLARARQRLQAELLALTAEEAP